MTNEELINIAKLAWKNSVTGISSFEIPNPMPTSTSVNITGKWYDEF